MRRAAARVDASGPQIADHVGCLQRMGEGKKGGEHAGVPEREPLDGRAEGRGRNVGRRRVRSRKVGRDAGKIRNSSE